MRWRTEEGLAKPLIPKGVMAKTKVAFPRRPLQENKALNFTAPREGTHFPDEPDLIFEMES